MNELFDDVQELFCDTIDKLVRLADKHSFDRDSLVEKFADIVYKLSEIATLREYEVEE